MLFLPRTDAAPDQFADSDAVTTIAFAATLAIDDSWLEAVLDNLALAELSRHDGVQLLKRLDEFERQLSHRTSSDIDARMTRLSIVVGDHFSDAFNAHEMRAPDTMTGQNVLETIERAAQYFVSEGHAAALRQLAFFISGNIEEVIADEDGEED